MLSLADVACLCRATGDSVVPPFQMAPLYVEWQQFGHDVLGDRGLRAKLLSWLPHRTREALLEELRRAAGKKTPLLCRGSGGSVTEKRATSGEDCTLHLTSEEKSTGEAVKQGAKRSLATPSRDADLDFDGYDHFALAALTFLALLLCPVIDVPILAARTAPEKVLQQLECICASLLRCSLRSNTDETNSCVLSASGATATASMWADAQARVATASLQLWVFFFLSFFLDQLHGERARVAALSASVAHLRHVHLPPSTQEKRQDGDTLASPKHPEAAGDDGDARRRSSLQRRFPLHFFSQSLRETALRIQKAVEDAPQQGAQVLFSSAVLHTKSAVLLKRQELEQTRYKQGRQTAAALKHARQSRRVAGKRFRCASSRSSSSSSTPSSRSSSVCSRNTNKVKTGNACDEADNRVTQKGTVLGGHPEDYTSDDDVPLADLVPLIRRAK